MRMIFPERRPCPPATVAANAVFNALTIAPASIPSGG